MDKNYMEQFDELKNEVFESNHSKETVEKIFKFMNLLENNDIKENKIVLELVYTLLGSLTNNNEYNKKINNLYYGNNDDKINESELCRYFSNNDEIYYFEKYSRKIIGVIFNPFFGYCLENNKTVKVSTFYSRINGKLELHDEKIKYVERITKGNDDKKLFVIYNLETLVSYTIICEKNEGHIVSAGFSEKILSDLTLLFNDKKINEILMENNIKNGSNN